VLYATLSRHVQYKPLYRPPQDEKQPYPRTAYRTPQRNPLLSLGPDPQGTALHLESTHDYYHTTSATSQPPFLFPYRSSARRCKPLFSSHIRHFPSPENSPSTHRQTDNTAHPPNLSAPENLPTYPARSTIPPSSHRVSSKQATRADPSNPTKKKNENRAGQKSKNEGIPSRGAETPIGPA
jgi:hypothetical protein